MHYLSRYNPEKLLKLQIPNTYKLNFSILINIPAVMLFVTQVAHPMRISLDSQLEWSGHQKEKYSLNVITSFQGQKHQLNIAQAPK